MKRHILLIIALITTLTVFGENAAVKRANALYAQKNYTAAIQQYEMIRQIQGESPELYFNLGNAYYRTGDIAHAILNYNRALLLRPNYDDAQFNLQIAQRKVTDNVDVTTTFFLVDWVNDLGDIFSSDGWAMLSIILFIVSLISLLFYLFARYRTVRKVSFNLTVVTCLITLISVGYAFKQSNKVANCTDGIIMTGSVTAKDSPALSGKDMFVLHSGTKVTIRNNVSGWVEIELPDGNAGFIPANDIEKI
jgi:tetratricopeptide (TPR) repeat protein